MAARTSVAEGGGAPKSEPKALSSAPPKASNVGRGSAARATTRAGGSGDAVLAATAEKKSSPAPAKASNADTVSTTATGAPTGTGGALESPKPEKGATTAGCSAGGAAAAAVVVDDGDEKKSNVGAASSTRRTTLPERVSDVDELARDDAADDAASSPKPRKTSDICGDQR